ncbi:AAA family ATPase [Candidatus Woesearchaeota archaeon]|nr:AAA family ATPase [Candidatus Woesearchaeota archaeon]
MSTNATLHLVCGIIGSGKTTFADWYARKEGLPVVHYDTAQGGIDLFRRGNAKNIQAPVDALLNLEAAVRASAFAASCSAAELELCVSGMQTNMEAAFRAVEHLWLKGDVILEGPSFDPDKRYEVVSPLEAMAQQSGLGLVKVAYWMDTPRPVAIERFLRRELGLHSRRKPGEAEVAAEVRKFQPLYELQFSSTALPTKAEGFAAVTIVSSAAPGRYEMREVSA